MGDVEQLLWRPAHELRNLLDAKDVSSLDLTEAYLSRIERCNPALSAFITVCADMAIRQAKAADQATQRGDRLGPLHGIPASIKDLIWTEGITTTGGSLVYRDFVPEEDSVVHSRLRSAGAVVIGKTNTSEFGMFRRTLNRLQHECVTPWDLERTSGGSSGGAAVAAASALGALAIGTDGGGSIRVPAAFNGVFGILPSRGRVPRHGGFFDAPRNPRKGIGPISRDVRDAALALEVIAGPDNRDPMTVGTPQLNAHRNIGGGIEGLRVAWSRDLGHLQPLDPRVVNVAEAAALRFEELGAHVESPGLRLSDPFDLFDPRFNDSEFAAGWQGHEGSRATPATAVEDPYQALREDPATASVLSPYLSIPGFQSSLLEYLLRIPPHVRKMDIDSLASIFDRFDLLLTPTISSVSPPCEETLESWDYTQYTYIANLAGYPAASMPCGFVDDLPVGLQLIGRVNDELTILRAARAFEQMQPWAHYRPSALKDL